MKSKKAIEVRSKLTKKEEELSRELEFHSDELDTNISKNMKTLALVGAGIAVGFVIYKLLSTKKINTERKTHINTKPEGPKTSVMTELLSGVVRGLVPIVLSKISNSKSDGKNIKTA